MSEDITVKQVESLFLVGFYQYDVIVDNDVGLGRAIEAVSKGVRRVSSDKNETVRGINFILYLSVILYFPRIF